MIDDLELYIIILPKYKEQKDKKQSELDLWLEFIEKPEVILKMKNKSIDINTIMEITGLTKEEIENI